MDIKKKSETKKNSKVITKKVHFKNLKLNQGVNSLEELKKIKTNICKDYNKNGVIDSYNVELDSSLVNVLIKREGCQINYTLNVPELGTATIALLEEVRNELVSATTIGMKEILDQNSFIDMKKRFMNESTALLKSKMPSIDEKTKGFLIGKLMREMLGLGDIEFLVNDPNLEEIVIPTSKETIRVYHKKYGWLSTTMTISREEEISNYSNIIARRVGRQINVLNPLLDAHLVSGDRVNSILYPISTKGNTITIRKFARDPYTIIDLINLKTCDLHVAAILWLAIEYEMNVLISGGTASGKTVLLNACMPFIPPNHRIISVEDTRELMLPDFLYWTPLVTRLPNAEGKGGVTMLDLLINSLRMRPDRIILGEMRRQEEAMVLFEAMHTGHSVYATLHADSAAETVSRLTNPPLNIPPNLLKAVNLNVIMFRDRRRGIRRVSQIGEFDIAEDKATANIIYRWVPEEDKIVKHSESSKFFESLTRNTGMSQKEIEKNLEEKKSILKWLIKNNIRDLNSFGRVVNMYYLKKEDLISAVSSDNPKKIFGE